MNYELYIVNQGMMTLDEYIDAINNYSNVGLTRVLLSIFLIHYLRNLKK